MSENKGQNYLHGAAILTAGVVIMKILGMIYKIPIGNLLSDEGYSIFLAAYNVYSVFLTIATAGLPVALSRMVSEAHTLGRENQVKKVFGVAWWTFLVLGFICAGIMFLFPRGLAELMNNVEAAESIFVLAPGVLFVCILSAYRGYIQGHGDMKPTTVSQVIEVLVKVIVGLSVCWLLIRSGKGLPRGSAGAISGVTVGGLVALIYIYISKKRGYPDRASEYTDVPDSTSTVFKNLLRICIPITIGSSVLSLINLADNSLVMGRLQDAAGFGYTEAKILCGVYGKAQTLYNLPAAFITPITISVVPAIAAAVARRDGREATGITESSMRISAVISLPMGVGLAVLSNPIINVIYAGSNERGPQLLMLLGIAAFFVCMSLVTTAILQAYGRERYPVYSMLLGGAVKISINWVLVGNPDFNIVGAPIGTICCYVVMCVMNFVFMCRFMEHRPSLSKTLLRPALSCAVMAAAAWAVYGLVSRLLSGGGELGWKMMALSMLLAVAIAAAVYAVMVIMTRAITLEDVKLIPKGDKIAKILHIH